MAEKLKGVETFEDDETPSTAGIKCAVYASADSIIASVGTISVNLVIEISRWIRVVVNCAE